MATNQIASESEGVFAGENLEPLTRREREVLALLAERLSGPEIAERLTLGRNSVKTHIKHLYAKLGANSKRQAVARARELGLLPGVAQVPSTVSPARALPPRARHNLPTPMTRFIGRQDELAEIAADIRACRLVTLTGSGGVGKTRLALRVAQEVLDDFPNGVWLVEMAPLSDPALVPQQTAIALGMRPEPGIPFSEALSNFLREREILVLIDNCEHLLAACAELADSLLRACPQLRIFATSREPLSIYGEAVHRVPSLPFPNSGQQTSVQQAQEFASVALFVDRARLVRPEYLLAAEDAPAVIRICQRLDGIPLAIEMAAARINSLAPQQVADRLDDVFTLLTARGRAALRRHQTLRATIEWSYQFLNESERLLLQRLSLFVGGCSLEAAEAVCSGQGLAAGEVLDLMDSLTSKSVLTARQRPGEPARYWLLETIRQFAWEKLLESGQAEAVQARHMDCFFSLAEQAAAQWPGIKQIAWARWLDEEFDNFRAAVQFSRRDRASDERCQRLVVALSNYWYIRPAWREPADWVQDGLTRQTWPAGSLEWARALHFKAKFAICGSTSARDKHNLEQMRTDIQESIKGLLAAGVDGQRDLAYALITLGEVDHFQEDFSTKAALAEESAALFRLLGDKWGLAGALHRLADTKDPLVNYQPRGVAGARPPLPELEPAARNDHSAERALHEECLMLYRETGDRWGQAEAILDLGITAAVSGDRVTGRRYFNEYLEIQNSFNDRGAIAHCLIFLGFDALAEDDLAAATDFFRHSLSIREDIQFDFGKAWALYNLAEVARRRREWQSTRQLLTMSLALRQQTAFPDEIAAHKLANGRLALSEGDFVLARDLFMQALTTWLESGHPINLACGFHALGTLAASQKQYERAARLLGAAQPYHAALYFFWNLPPIWRAEHECSVAATRAQLGEVVFARVWADGENMTLSETVACALADSDE